MKTKDEYIERLASELKAWDAQINYLFAKTQNVPADVKAKYAEELDELRKKHQAARDKLKEVEQASKLKEWRVNIYRMTVMAGNPAADVQSKLEGEFDTLSAKYDTASEKIKALEEANEEAWNSVKDSTEKFWEDLRFDLVKVHSKLN